VALRPKNSNPAASQGNSQRAAPDAAKALLRTLIRRFLSFEEGSVTAVP
jgi:hypothetical protein